MYLRIFRFATGNTSKQYPECSKEWKVKSSYSINQILGRIRPLFLWLVPYVILLITHGLYNGCQVVWIFWTFFSPSRGNQRVIWSLMYIQALRQDWKVQKYKLQSQLKKKNRIVSSKLNLLDFNNLAAYYDSILSLLSVSQLVNFVSLKI